MSTTAEDRVNAAIYDMHDVDLGIHASAMRVEALYKDLRSLHSEEVTDLLAVYPDLHAGEIALIQLGVKRALEVVRSLLPKEES